VNQKVAHATWQSPQTEFGLGYSAMLLSLDNKHRTAIAGFHYSCTGLLCAIPTETGMPLRWSPVSSGTDKNFAVQAAGLQTPMRIRNTTELDPRLTNDMHLWVRPTADDGSCVLAAVSAFGTRTDGLTAQHFESPRPLLVLGRESFRVDISTHIPVRPGPSRRRAAALLALLALLFTALSAFAHDVRGTAIYVDLGENIAALELQLPPAQLALAGPELAATLAPHNENFELVKAYVQRHLHAQTANGRPFTVTVTDAARARIDDGDVLLVHASLRAPEGQNARRFELEYDGIVHRVAAHEVYVFVRRDVQTGKLDEKPELVGMLHYQETSVEIDRRFGSFATAFSTTFRLGARHISEGTDHLLFLFTLLLPAGLSARNRRWSGPSRAAQSARQTIKIVTAFTAGHSLTLLLGAVYGAVNSTKVEVLIAVSILVSAVHALLPIFPRREALIAGTFGLVHGLAFASALSGMGLDGATLTCSLLGFNVGIEAAQLGIVLVTLPWLLLLSQSEHYSLFRVPAAFAAATAASGWILERALGIATPIPRLVQGIADHAVWLVAALALLSFASRAGTLARQPRAAP
jgi:hypothetical protein